jgi:hypothetical protein
LDLVILQAKKEWKTRSSLKIRMIIIFICVASTKSMYLTCCPWSKEAGQ